MKGVVFDFGGVMTTTTMPERVHRLAGEIGVDWEVLKAGYSKYRLLMDGGYIDMREMYDLTLADADVSLGEDVLEKIISEDVASFCYRNEETLSWMRELKAKGFKIGILTNMSPSFVAPFKEHFGDFIGLADAMVISGQERMFKPQRRIYDLMSRRLGVEPGEILFIDDSEANCDGARRAGWKAIRFTSLAEARRAAGECAVD